jgi:hypothetical protein
MRFTRTGESNTNRLCPPPHSKPREEYLWPCVQMEKQIQSSEAEPPEYKHYFVDEAGDATIFGSRGQVLVGKEGCSRFFMLGIVDVKDPKRLAEDLASLRTKILADPYFKGVPSLQPEERKTALLFHAKDDLPEIRREVFARLQTHELRFSAIVRDKLAVLTYVRRRNETDPSFLTIRTNCTTIWCAGSLKRSCTRRRPIASALHAVETLIARQR